MNPSFPVVCLVLTLLAGCLSSRTVADELGDRDAVPVVSQWSGQYGKSDRADRRVITTAAEWRDAWALAHGEKRGAAVDPPAVDFGRHVVLAVFMGQQRTGGFSIRITRVIRTPAGGVTAHVRETAPPRDGMVTMALTSPWHFVVVEKVEAGVTFADETR